jgi:predicted HTH transcriptional regulator
MHASVPVNPILAHPAYLAGYIEEMGTGTSDIIEKCLDSGLDAPEFVQEEAFRVIIWRARIDDAFGVRSVEDNADIDLYEWQNQQKRIKRKDALFANKDKRTKRADVAEKQKAVVKFCSEPRSSMEIMEHIGVSRQTRTVNLYIGDLVKAGKLRPMIPDKPNSPRQRYVATRVGNWMGL